MSTLLKLINKRGVFKTAPLTVLDIGARAADIGHWKLFSPDLRYFGFDADKEECDRLNDALRNKVTGWEERYFPIALSGEIGERLFHITSRPECSSLLSPNIEAVEDFRVAEYLVERRTCSLNTQTLSLWAKTYDVHHVDFIKVDVQGAELEILQGGREIVSSALALEVEVEFIEVYKDQPLFGDVDSWIRPMGFILFDLLPIYKSRISVPEESMSRGQLVWGDVLYLKNINSLLSECPENRDLGMQIMKLAAIADLYGRPDYSIHVLQKAIKERESELKNYLELINSAIGDYKLSYNADKRDSISGTSKKSLHSRLLRNAYRTAKRLFSRH